jgi:hypothetical protein
MGSIGFAGVPLLLYDSLRSPADYSPWTGAKRPQGFGARISEFAYGFG